MSVETKLCPLNCEKKKVADKGILGKLQQFGEILANFHF